MALNAYLTLKGQTQGNIKGSVTQKGREGKIMVIAAHHEVLQPHDPATGQATGKRRHSPFVITKEVDKSSPLLYTAWATNEKMLQWQLQFWRPGPAGVEKQAYTIELVNANIASIGLTMPNNKVPETANLAEYEDIAFVYQNIKWIWTDGNLTASDNFAAAAMRASRRRR